MQTDAPRATRDYRLATAALVAWALALVGFGSATQGFVLALHLVALLGARGAPLALGFNLCAFVLPGVLLAWAAVRLRSRIARGGWAPRIGLQLVLLSALAFAAQGLLPIDARDLDAPASQRHALAWTLWWIAFVPGALLAARGWQKARGFGIALALLVPVLVLFGAEFTAAPLAHRLACVAWFAWWLGACRRM